ncbi:MAG: FecR family protein [Oculatellaceae cyanobacterium bins.114]|nr:FecR family protein [Oculatellaceae cyanobacterium bins.114]
MNISLPECIRRVSRQRWEMFPQAFALALIILLLLSAQGITQQSVQVRVDRWLDIQEMTGSVTFYQQNNSRVARVGDRLQSVGDGIRTGQQSNAVLAVDTGVGFVTVSENTQAVVRTLAIAPDNGRITHLDVSQGQVRLNLRRFTHRGSEFEIHTPAGVSAVRGTDFGVSIQPDGKTGIATLTGEVSTSAQGQTVAVAAGFQNLIIPGEVPSPAVPLQDNTDLRYTIDRQIQNNLRSVRLNAQVDPVNLVFVGDTPQDIDREGRFSLRLRAVYRQRIEITVITPLGKRQVHQLVIVL